MRRFTHTFPQRISAFLLCLALLVGLLPTAAFAAGTDTGKAIQLVDSGTAANIGGGQADNIYFGTYQQSSASSTEPDGTEGVDWIKSDTANKNGQGPYYYIDPIKWRVLENAGGQLFLVSDQNLDVFRYHTDRESVTWEKSTMRSWLNGYGASENTGGDNGTDYTSDNFIGAAFSEKEQKAIAATTVVNDDNPNHNTDDGNDTTDQIFLLSIAEAQNSSYFADNSSRIATNTAYVAGGGKLGSSYRNGVGEADYWWLRSPGDLDHRAAGVSVDGGVGRYVYSVRTYNAVRPAFNLDLNSVLFTSAAEGGKTDSAVDSSLTAVKDYAGNEWKLTLLDGGRSFTASTSSATTQTQGYSNWTVEVTYSVAQTGSNEYVSAMLVDGSGSVLYYGRVAQPGEATGTATITIPSGLTAGNYTLKVFSEQYNGDKMTDYASEFQDVTLHVHSWSADWSRDDTHHWHNCTAADCPVSDNSQKDGYAEHVYDQQVATDSYLVSPATCTQAATYYKSCSCGAKGTETFTSGNPTGHTPEAEWQHDGNTHWNECASCGIKLNEAAHVYDDGQDDTCNACEYVRTTYTLTINLNNGSGSTTGGEYAEGAVIHIDAGSRSNYRFNGWTTSKGGSFADASSASTTFTMPAADTTITANWQYDPPYIPPSKPNWTSVARKLANAQPGDTVTVKMNGETEVPGDVWETIAGRDVTVILDMGGNVSWTVDGNDVPTATHFADMDFGVDRNTTGIDVDVINAITGQVSSVQITLAHDGEFGFTLTLTAPLGRENAGSWANLYHYDEDAESLSYETSGEIQEDGSASLKMTHASQYAIIIDDQTHQLPFEDVTSGTWYEGAVRYAYLHDIMEGMSATTFVPGKSLTRAEAVQVLYNMEGKPEGSGNSTFPDLVYEWYKPAIAWAEQTGVVDGYEDGTFRPDQPVTRMEFAQMLYNYAKYKDYDLTAQGDLSQFPDSGSVADWAEIAMEWANGNELINGHDDGTIDAGGAGTRAQAASILMRFDQDLAE